MHGVCVGTLQPVACRRPRSFADPYTPPGPSLRPNARCRLRSPADPYILGLPLRPVACTQPRTHSISHRRRTSHSTTVLSPSKNASCDIKVLHVRRAADAHPVFDGRPAARRRAQRLRSCAHVAAHKVRARKQHNGPKRRHVNNAVELVVELRAHHHRLRARLGRLRARLGRLRVRRCHLRARHRRLLLHAHRPLYVLDLCMQSQSCSKPPRALAPGLRENRVAGQRQRAGRTGCHRPQRPALALLRDSCRALRGRLGRGRLVDDRSQRRPRVPPDRRPFPSRATSPTAPPAPEEAHNLRARPTREDETLAVRRVRRAGESIRRLPTQDERASSIIQIAEN